jgi:acetyl esterase
VTAEFDVLRDEGEAYAAKLRGQGNSVTLRRFNGMIHVFFVLNKVIPKANEAIDDCIDRLKTNLRY